MAANLRSNRPSSGGKTGKVWDTADRISKETGRPATRKEVIDVILSAGGNYNTASKQYYDWRKSRTSADATAPASTQSVVLQMGRDGRVLVPQSFRLAMGIDDSTKLSARVDNGELRIVPQRLAVARLQALVKEHDKGRGSAVDELLKDRRVEAARP